MGSTEITIGIVSDLHACTLDKKDAAVPSHLDITLPEHPTTHPIAGLLTLIRNEKDRLSADLLLSAGDIGDKAKPDCIVYAWKVLHQLKDALNADLIIPAVGNHDVDSRYKYTKYDARGFLQALTPSFPFDSEDLNDRFWSRHHALIDRENWRLLILNSSAFHGTKPDEIDHGRISEFTFNRVKAALEQSSVRPINILLCHHHPHPHAELEIDYEVMHDGSRLLQLLGTGRYGEWLIIHGHKHYPRLCYAPGTPDAPIIFSAGSLCANLGGELGTKVPNQFYILRISLADCSASGLCGTFRSWDWSKGIGWMPAGPNDGLPAYGGFGYRGSTTDLVKDIKAQVTPPFVEWSQVAKNVPKLQYVLPDQMKSVYRELKLVGLHVLFNDQGFPMQIGHKE